MQDQRVFLRGFEQKSSKVVKSATFSHFYDPFLSVSARFSSSRRKGTGFRTVPEGCLFRYFISLSQQFSTLGFTLAVKHVSAKTAQKWSKVATFSALFFTFSGRPETTLTRRAKPRPTRGDQHTFCQNCQNVTFLLFSALFASFPHDF